MMTWINRLHTSMTQQSTATRSTSDSNYTSNYTQRMRTRAIATLLLGVAVGVGSSFEALALERSGDRLAQTTPDAPSSETGADSESPSSSPTSDPTAADTARFNCQLLEGEYTVMYNPESQPSDSYAWAAPGDMGGGWSADRRCAEISRRLEAYRPDGLLELRTGVENGYNTVCATTEQNPTCRIVFTVPNGQDPLLTRDRVFENLAAANSGQNTDAVNTYRSGGTYEVLERIGSEFGFELPSLPGQRQARSTRASSINLRPFLAPSDGGTGEYLRSDTPSLLNPEDFR